MRVYLDNCCWNRPYDDRSQERIDREASAVFEVMEACQRNGCTIFGSKTLEHEIGRIRERNVEKYMDVHELYLKMITDTVPNDEDVIDERVEKLCKHSNITGLDVKHLSNAVLSEVDYLFTTDDDFEAACSRMYLNVQVINPLKFVEVDMDKALRADEVLEVRERTLDVCERESEYRKNRLEDVLAFLNKIRNDPNRRGWGDYTAEKQAENRRLRAQMAMA